MEKEKYVLYEIAQQVKDGNPVRKSEGDIIDFATSEDAAKYAAELRKQNGTRDFYLCLGWAKQYYKRGEFNLSKPVLVSDKDKDQDGVFEQNVIIFRERV